MINVDDELLCIDNEYSEKEIFLKYGVAIIADDSAKPLDF